MYESMIPLTVSDYIKLFASNVLIISSMNKFMRVMSNVAGI
jgi:hypothetical protein